MHVTTFVLSYESSHTVVSPEAPTAQSFTMSWLGVSVVVFAVEQLFFVTLVTL